MQIESYLGRQLTTFGKNIIKDLYTYRKQKKVEEFILCVEKRYESMTADERKQFCDALETAEGQMILEDYLDQVLATRSRVLRVALALLYCRDDDLNINKKEEAILVRALSELDDDLIKFYILVSDLKANTDETEAYRLASVWSNSYQSVLGAEWSPDYVISYIQKLIRINLLLPDPANFRNPPESGWFIYLGFNNLTYQSHYLLRKSIEISREI